MPGRAPSRVSTTSGFAHASRSRSAAGRSELPIEAAIAAASAFTGFTGAAAAALQLRARTREPRTAENDERRMDARSDGEWDRGARAASLLLSPTVRIRAAERGRCGLLRCVDRGVALQGRSQSNTSALVRAELRVPVSDGVSRGTRGLRS